MGNPLNALLPCRGFHVPLFAAVLMLGCGGSDVAQNGNAPPAAPQAAPIAPPSEVVPPVEPVVEPPVEEQPVEPAEEPPAVEAPTEPPPAEEPSPQPAGPKRLPIPSAAQQEPVKAQMAEIFELSRERTPIERQRLVRELHDLGLGTSLEKPIERWVLIRQAIDLGVELADVRIVLDMVDTLGRDYEFDADSVKEAFLIRMAATAADADSLWEVIEQGHALAETLMAAEKFENAEKICEALGKACQGTLGRDFRKPVFEFRTALSARREAWNKLQAARAALAANPADVEANLLLGRWEFFELGDAAAALPHLANGTDATLAAAAKLELAGAADAEGEVAIADAWYAAAERSRSDTEKQKLLHHAGRWYKQAEPAAASQLTKVKIERRLAEIGPLPTATAGTVASAPIPISPETDPAELSPTQRRQLQLAVRAIAARDCILCLNFEKNTFSSDGKRVRDFSPKNWQIDVQGTTPLEPGIGGAGRTFNGVDDCFIIPNLREFLAGGCRAFTVVYWYRRHHEKTSTVFDIGDATNASINMRGSNLYLSDRNGGGKIDLGAIAANRWYHLAFRWDGQEISAVLDGEEFATRTTTLESLNSRTLVGATARIGAQAKEYERHNRMYDGDLDEFLMFTRALTLEEIETLYQYGLAGGILGE